MQFEYNGYILEVEEDKFMGTVRIKLTCELWSPFSNHYYTVEYWKANSESLIEDFKQQVDRKLAK